MPEFAVFVHSEARSSEWRTRCEKQDLKPQGAGVEDTEWRTAVLERSSFWVTFAYDSRSFVVPACRTSRRTCAAERSAEGEVDRFPDFRTFPESLK